MNSTVQIKTPPALSEVEVSEAYADEPASQSDLEIMGEKRPVKFRADGPPPFLTSRENVRQNADLNDMIMPDVSENAYVDEAKQYPIGKAAEGCG